MKRRNRNIKKQIEIGEYNEEHLLGQIASANGIIKHSNGYNLRTMLELDSIKETILERRKYGK